jgi:HD-GYP domain-containing protein (c-di-GMP phosphodiesterase class II)
MDHFMLAPGLSGQDMLDVFTHGQNVAETALMVAGSIGLGERVKKAAYVSGIYHDVGKCFIERELVFKKGELTDEEKGIVKTHALYGCAFVGKIFAAKDYGEFVLYHHEDFDGGGYYGLKGKNIPLVSRVVRIADCFDALRSDRPYRKALPLKEALDIMDEEASRKFDIEIYKVFRRFFGNISLNAVARNF